MGKAGAGILGLIGGLLIGAFGVSALGLPMAAGAGAGVGVLTGACAVADTAGSLGLLSPAEVDQVFAAMPAHLSADARPPAEPAGADTATACKQFIAKTRA